METTALTSPAERTEQPSAPQPQRPPRSVPAAYWLAGLAVLVGVVMILVGWRERTTFQTLMLGLSNLPISAGAGIVLAHLARRHAAALPTSWPKILKGSYAAIGFGLLLYAIAYTVGPQALGPLGQFFIFVTLAVLYVVVIAALVRSRTGRAFHFEARDLL